ncbi:MAG: glycoside-pentoside-hexuronide (GPH):cation symporter [Clostridia bacterium]|nr:glycoside-pentoside-hexuronide (GPH):cation symporter [Clostridia bacterium]
MQKLPFKEKIGYGVGAVGLDLSYGLFYSYLSIYLTDALGITPWFLLILTPLARIWDGINDPMMGSIVDVSHNKMGKYRPWILRGAILNAIVLILMFNTPAGIAGSKAVYAYVALFYVLWGMTNTLADIPYWSMIPSFANEEKDRNLISTIARTFSGLGQGIIGILTVPMVAILSRSKESSLENMSSNDIQKGLGSWAAICAVLLVAFAVICVASTKERNVIQAGEKFSLKKAIGVIKNNDQLLVFMLFAMISNAGYYMTSGISNYYFKSVTGVWGNQSIFFTLGAVGSVLGLLVIPVCSKFNLTNRSTYKISLSLAAAGYIGMAIVGYGFGGNVFGLGVCYMVASIGIGSMFVNQTVMLSDIVDYGEYKLGTRNQSLTFSMKGFLQKMAYTIQSIIMYASFGITKYQVVTGNQVVQQTAMSKSAISALMFIVPPLFILISLAIFSKKYKIHGQFKTEILEAIAQKREAENE